MPSLQVKSEYVHHKAISGAIGVKLCATGIEKAVAGTPIMVVGPEDDEEDIKEEVTAAGRVVLLSACAATFFCLLPWRTAKFVQSVLAVCEVHGRLEAGGSSRLERAVERTVCR